MITGFVRGQALKVPAVYVAADTINYLTAQFVFQTSEWNGLEVWSHWEKSGVAYDIRLDDGRITEEMHLNLSAGAWRVYLHGNRYSDGEVVQRITTGVAVIEVQPTGTLDGEPFPEMPSSVTEQILARLDDVEQNGGGGAGGFFVGEEADMPAGTVVRFNPKGKATKIPQVDETLTKPGYAADAAAVGDALNKQSDAIEKLKESDLQSATGNVVSLETMKDVKITLESEIEGTTTLIHQSKNFLPSPMDNAPNKTENGITYTANEDGSVTMVGTLTGSSSYYYMNQYLGTRRTLPPGKYTLSTRAEGTLAPIYLSFTTSIIPGTPDLSKGVSISFEITEARTENLSVQLLNNGEYNGKFWMQIERGENATDFEKFKEEKLTVSFPCVINAYDGTNVFYTENYDTITATAKKDIRAEILNEVNEIVKFDASAYSMPVLRLRGNTTEMTKENAVNLEYEFEGRTGTCSCKWQGNSSLTFPKKNYTIKFDTAFEAVDGWGEQKKYCAKANYNDFTQSRNVVSAKIWGEVYEKRTDKNEKLVTSPNYGAIDGFPVCIVLNDEFHGLYCFNIPKDAWMMGMGDGTNECILCAELHVPATKFESGNAVLDGTDFKLEYITNEDDIAWAVTSVNNLLSACGNSDGTNLDTIGTMLDWDSAIDYYIYSVMLRNSDGLSKNYLLSTYDGTKWFFTAYDMDTVFGNNWNGSGYVSPTYGINFEEAAEENRLFRLIKTYKSAELKARYEYLRKNALSEARIATLFSDYAGNIPLAVYYEENRTWKSAPRTSVQTIDSILNWYRLRCQYIDSEVTSWE